MSESMHSHLVEIDEQSKRLVIYRIYPDGRKHLYTEVALPQCVAADKSVFEQIARTLGENILLD